MPNPTPENAPSLLEAVNALTRTTALLSERVDVSARQAWRTRMLSLAVVVFVLIVSAFGGWQYTRVNRAIEGTAADAVISCQNANDTRAANLALWTFIVSLSRASADPATQAGLDNLQAWVTVLYAPHDCTDLSKKYTIPPPPDFPTPSASASPTR